MYVGAILKDSLSTPFKGRERETEIERERWREREKASLCVWVGPKWATGLCSGTYDCSLSQKSFITLNGLIISAANPDLCSSPW